MQNEIQELRHQVRMLKRLVLAGFGLFLAAGLLAATSPQHVADVIQAKKFEVVNTAGETAISMSSNKEGGTIEINNEQGQQIALLESLGSGGTLHLKDPKLKLQTTLMADTQYGVALMLWADCNDKWPAPGLPVAIVTAGDPTPTSKGSGLITLLSSTDVLNSSSILLGSDAQDKTFFGFEAIDKNGNVVTKAGIDHGATGVLTTIKPKQP